MCLGLTGVVLPVFGNNMKPLNETLLRLPEVLRRFPVSRSVWYARVKAGLYPAPIKAGRLSLWRASEVQNLIDQLATKEAI